MKNSAMALLVASVLAAPLTLAGASPLSITFAGDAQTADGTPYKNYQVKCSNNRTHAISRWEESDQWCVGEQASENCSRKKIKAAKLACKQK